MPFVLVEGIDIVEDRFLLAPGLGPLLTVRNHFSNRNITADFVKTCGSFLNPAFPCLGRKLICLLGRKIGVSSCIDPIPAEDLAFICHGEYAHIINIIGKVRFGQLWIVLRNQLNGFNYTEALKHGDAAKENEELKKEVQTLTDEVELLNVTVDKYKAAASVPAIVTTPEVSTSDDTQKKEKDETKTDKKPTTNVNEENGETFSPETVTGTDAKTPEDVEEPITIIDISE